MLSLLVSIAHAGPSVGEAMIFADDAYECTVKVDGQPFGKLPVHALKFTGGHHAFRVECPDGRIATAEQDVTLVEGGVARIELKGLAYSAPTPETPSGPVPTYVLLSAIRGEKVSIDGAAPVTLPAKVNLSVGSHSFVVIQPNGTRGAAIRKDVVSHDGQAVVKLD